MSKQGSSPKIDQSEEALICDIEKCSPETTRTAEGDVVSLNNTLPIADSCHYETDGYSISWSVDDKNNVNFELDTKINKGKFWTAIGIGDNMEVERR